MTEYFARGCLNIFVRNFCSFSGLRWSGLFTLPSACVDIRTLQKWNPISNHEKVSFCFESLVTSADGFNTAKYCSYIPSFSEIYGSLPCNLWKGFHFSLSSEQKWTIGSALNKYNLIQFLIKLCFCMSETIFSSTLKPREKIIQCLYSF